LSVQRTSAWFIVPGFWLVDALSSFVLKQYLYLYTAN
jgi:hypothetical protein